MKQMSELERTRLLKESLRMLRRAGELLDQIDKRLERQYGQRNAA